MEEVEIVIKYKVTLQLTTPLYQQHHLALIIIYSKIEVKVKFKCKIFYEELDKIQIPTKKLIKV